MNNSSTVDISKSSLVSLKAEILKKREELNIAKLQNQNKVLKPQKPLEIKNKGIQERQERDTEEDINLLQKSRERLEKKAKLYDRLSKANGLNEDEILYSKRTLVHFGKKKLQSRIPDLPENLDEPDDVDKHPAESEDEEKHFSDEYEAPSSPGEEWVEYTDCLGRTRKCLRKDLEAIKAKDNELSTTLDPEKKKVIESQKFVQEKSPEPSEKVYNPVDINEDSEMLSSDMRREILRQQWEKEEEVLRNKSDIHYQDILFNEARSHGVGYFGFSKDEEERAKQQEQLKKLRKETVTKQETLKAQKIQREKILKARLKAARNRKRARMGLPPEDDEPEPLAEPVIPKIDPEEEKRKKKQEEKEKLLEMKRKQDVRPWDIGKEGLKVINKKHYEMTQEEWVDRKRKERPDEFAPPTAYSKKRRDFKSAAAKFDDVVVPEQTTLYFSSKKPAKKSKAPETTVKVPEMELNDFDPAVPPPSFSYPVTNKSVNPYKRKNYVPQASVPIMDECVDFDDEQDKGMKHESKETDSSSEEEPVVTRKRAEIPPPPTIEYYGPSDSKKKTNLKQKPNFEDSIAAGLKFLRDQAEKKIEANAKRVIFEH